MGKILVKLKRPLMCKNEQFEKGKVVMDDKYREKGMLPRDAVILGELEEEKPLKEKPAPKAK